MSRLLKVVFQSENSDIENEYTNEFQTYLEEFSASDQEQEENKQMQPQYIKKDVQKIEKESQIYNEEPEKINSDSEEEFMEINISNFDNLEIDSINKPKHLYDCLLGLRSENKERLENSLKCLAYLIRKNLDDLDVLSEELIVILLKINGDSFEFEENKKKSICALIIIQPEKISK